MQIITTAVIKGGTGKTTTAAALAQAAAAEGKKVLAIDLDPQGNLSLLLAADMNAGTAYHLLQGVPAADLIQTTPQGVDVIPAAPDLATEQTKPNSARRLADALEPVKQGYDFIFIDTPPTMGELLYNALRAATGVIIPLETDATSLQGLYQITDIIKQMQGSAPQLEILGVVLTRYDRRANLNRYLRETIANTGAEIGAPLLCEIRAGVAVKEAQAFRRSLYEYAPKSKPAADYLKLYELIKF